MKYEKYEETMRKIGSEVNLFAVKWLKSKLDTAKYSIFGCEYCNSDNSGLTV